MYLPCPYPLVVVDYFNQQFGQMKQISFQARSGLYILLCPSVRMCVCVYEYASSSEQLILPSLLQETPWTYRQTKTK